MSLSLRRTAFLALVGLLFLGALATPARAQRRPPGPIGVPLSLIRPQVAPWYAAPSAQTVYWANNVALMGRAMSFVPPYALGYNPYPSPIYNAGPIVPSLYGGYPSYGGYALSTLANPYATPGSLSTSPYGGYSMSTVGGYGGYGGSGGYPYGSPDSSLFGLASLTVADSIYYKNIQDARITRERSRQMALDTRRKQIEFEMWYETVRPTAPKLKKQEEASTLEWARNYAQNTEIWSGRSLNVLLKSIVRNGKLNRGPNISLDEDTLKHINLTDGASRGNVGLLRDGGKLHWPLVLTEKPFDEVIKPLNRKFREAVDQLKDKEPVSATTLRDIERLYTDLNDKLSNSADELAPSQYIEARRYLNQVGAAVRALKDPKARNYFDNTWNAKGKTVAELVDHMRKEGLEFAPATPGDEAAYNALYNALRAFEYGTQLATK